MWAFLTGAATAAVLVVATYFVLESTTVTSVERVDGRSVIVDEEVHSIPLVDG